MQSHNWSMRCNTGVGALHGVAFVTLLLHGGLTCSHPIGISDFPAYFEFFSTNLSLSIHKGIGVIIKKSSVLSLPGWFLWWIYFAIPCLSLYLPTLYNLRKTRFSWHSLATSFKILKHCEKREKHNNNYYWLYMLIWLYDFMVSVFKNWLKSHIETT